VSYYFPDLNELILQTYQRVMVRFVERRRAAAANVSDPALKLAVLIENGIPSGPDDHDAVLTYQMVGEPSASATCGMLSSMLFSQEVLLYESIIELGTQLGVFRPTLDGQTIARCLVSMEDALGLRIVYADSEIDRSAAIRDMRAVAEALLASCLPSIIDERSGRDSPGHAARRGP
jgi:AcrR family transcriptional regulator